MVFNIFKLYNSYMENNIKPEISKNNSIKNKYFVLVFLIILIINFSFVRGHVLLITSAIILVIALIFLFFKVRIKRGNFYFWGLAFLFVFNTMFSVISSTNCDSSEKCFGADLASVFIGIASFFLYIILVIFYELINYFIHRKSVKITNQEDIKQ